MAEVILILGDTGTGKSASIRNLPPDATAIIKSTPKSLPFKNGNLYKSVTMDRHEDIIKTLKRLDQNEDIKYIVLDDIQYTMSFAWMRSLLEPKTKDSEFTKYKQIGYDFWDLVQAVQSMRPDKFVFLLGHTEFGDDGVMRCKTIGKLLNDKITVEGLFTIVLNTIVYNDRLANKHCFQTQSNGQTTSKSPIGMFEKEEIPNDLKLVVDAIQQYNQ